MTSLPQPVVELPPGELVQLLDMERADRRYLLHAAEAYGPVFKALNGAHLNICIVGLERGHRFLRDHRDAITPVAPQLRSLFPEGFMRQMRGDVHRRYRSALTRAVDRGGIEAHREIFTSLVAASLDDYVQVQHEHKSPARALVNTLSQLASTSLIQLFFGCAPASTDSLRLVDGFHHLGPFGLVWNPGPQQHMAFDQLRTRVLELGLPDQDCVLKRVLTDATLDETMLGNLIYMVEMGRYDIQAYFRWLVWHAVQNPDQVDRIAGDPAPSRLATAFAYEALRMDESERLLRKVDLDIEFDGYLIPETSTVRICLWESHKLEKSFADPFTFDLSRFLDGHPSSDHYSPFGLDQHHCPFSTVAIQLGSVFIEGLARGYRASISADGDAVRGPYHWEPATRFAVELSAR